tara:strand:- start:418 stop:672 length:255 start_codon:yes stop_codon:yes gene_type:complete
MSEEVSAFDPEGTVYGLAQDVQDIAEPIVKPVKKVVKSAVATAEAKVPVVTKATNNLLGLDLDDNTTMLMVLGGLVLAYWYTRQ